MNEDIKELAEEIRSIVHQYKVEIRGRRKAWPTSIINRVLELSRKEISQNELVELTGIPYHTVLRWRRAAGEPLKSRPRPKKFHELAVRTSAVKACTVRDEKVAAEKPYQAVKVSVSGGYKLEFADPAGAAEFFKALKGGL